MHLAVLLWGFTAVLGRAIELSAPVLVWYRMLMTAVFVAIILRYRKQWVPIERKDKWRLVTNDDVETYECGQCFYCLGLPVYCEYLHIAARPICQ